jgi:hypothetical protein
MPNSHVYAALANDAYTDRRVGTQLAGHEKPVTIQGVNYSILEHADNPRTGYQGTIYRSQQDGQIIVAHRVPSRSSRTGCWPMPAWCSPATTCRCPMRWR